MRAQVNAIVSAAIVLLVWNGEWSYASENWPQFRGPEAAGVAEGTHLPERWSAKENVAWMAEIPGPGWSSPIAGAKKSSSLRPSVQGN